jgi:hypothetical protein
MKRAAATLVATSAAVVSLTSGCGRPHYQYVKNADHQVYFKVPRTWPRVDQKELNAAEDRVAGSTGPEDAKIVRQLIWSIAYEDSEHPTAARIFGSAALDGPIVYSKVRRLPQSQPGDVSLDNLRDIYLPVSAARRQAAAAGGAPVAGFTLLQDEVDTPGQGLRGVHVRYSYQVGAQLQTFDVTALVNDKKKKVYQFVIQCSAACFDQRKQEIEDVVHSFTVRDGK